MVFIYASQVKGHADDVMARRQQVREMDRLGNHAADEAADFGRRPCHCSVIDVWRYLSGLCGWWYPAIRDLQHFTIATSRAVVHDDGGGEGRECCSSGGLVCWLCPQEEEDCACAQGSSLASWPRAALGL